MYDLVQKYGMERKSEERNDLIHKMTLSESSVADGPGGSLPVGLTIGTRVSDYTTYRVCRVLGW